MVSQFCYHFQLRASSIICPWSSDFRYPVPGSASDIDRSHKASMAYLVGLGYIFQWISLMDSYIKLCFRHQAENLIGILLILLASIDVIEKRRSRDFGVLCC